VAVDVDLYLVVDQAVVVDLDADVVVCLDAVQAHDSDYDYV